MARGKNSKISSIRPANQGLDSIEDANALNSVAGRTNSRSTLPGNAMKSGGQNLTLGLALAVLLVGCASKPGPTRPIMARPNDLTFTILQFGTYHVQGAPHRSPAPGSPDR